MTESDGKFASDFLAENFVKILQIANSSFTKIDDELKIRLKLAYKNYLIKTGEKYSKSKSFFIRNQAVNIYDYYVPISIACGSTTINAPSFSNCLEHTKHMVITGTGGCGKTVLMKHLFLNCIKEKQYAPILIELRDLNSTNLSLNDFIEKTLDTYDFNTSRDYIKRAKEEGHFCFFLDGYDEVKQSIRKKLITQLKQISNKYPDCPAFISSRPDDDLYGINDFSIFKVLPLELDSALNLINKLPFDTKIKDKFMKELSNGLFNEHQSFLSNPLLLSIMLLTYSENAEIPNKLSIFYNQAYEALFQRHDAYKEGFNRHRLTDLDIQDFSRVFSIFSLQTYQKTLLKMPKTTCLDFIEKSKTSLDKDFKPGDYLEDLLNAACLLIEDGLEIAFSHRSFQEYFVAKYISSASPDIQKKLIHMYKYNMGSDKVISLLLEIDPELVERELLLPELEKIFQELKVKKNIGKTHAAKFFKKHHRTLNIEEHKISATFNDNSMVPCIIVDMIIGHCKGYTFPSSEFFLENSYDMNQKYGSESIRTKYKTSDLTYRTPVLSDLLDSKGKFSTEYLKAAFSAYKKLKDKYKNQADDIDALLGL